MSLPVILDVTIGLVALFLSLSLIASFLLELYVGMFNRHAKLLRRAIRGLLGDPQGTGLARSFYEHPLIQGQKSGSRLPSTIPSPIFARTILDLMQQAGAWPNGAASGVFRPLLTVANGDQEKLLKEIESWFDQSLGRLSGSIARRSQMWLFPIAIVLTLGLNVNTVKVYQALSTQQALREQIAQSLDPLVEQAEKVMENEEPAVDASPAEPAAEAPIEPEPNRAKLDAQIETFQELFGGLPLGWSCAAPEAVFGQVGAGTPSEASGVWRCIGFELGKASYRDWLGWLLTIVAISFGAQFWYRVLKSMIKLRNLSPTKPKAA